MSIFVGGTGEKRRGGVPSGLNENGGVFRYHCSTNKELHAYMYSDKGLGIGLERWHNVYTRMCWR